MAFEWRWSLIEVKMHSIALRLLVYCLKLLDYWRCKCTVNGTLVTGLVIWCSVVLKVCLWITIIIPIHSACTSGCSSFKPPKSYNLGCMFSDYNNNLLALVCWRFATMLHSRCATVSSIIPQNFGYHTRSPYLVLRLVHSAMTNRQRRRRAATLASYFQTLASCFQTLAS